MVLSKKKFILIFFILFILCSLYCQSMLSIWRGHLEVDVYVFYQRVEYFLKHQSFSLLKGNEHFPGALLFFFSPLIFCFSKFNYGNYLNSFLFINLILLAVYVFLIKKQANFVHLLLFLLILVVSGPILLFRFEILVSLLLIISLFLWQKKKIFFSLFCLGLALTIKIYPILILPYLLILLITKRWYQDLVIGLVGFLVGVLLPVIIFFALGGKQQQLFTSLNFHSAKPVSIESVPGVIITAISLWMDKKPPSLLGGYGLWGIKTKLMEYDPIFFNWLWLGPITFFYIFLFLNKKFNQQLKIGVIFWIISLFLLFSKNLNPQYLFWFILLFPLLKVKKSARIDYLILFAIIIVIVLLNQFVYPILYSDFINKFFTLGINKEIFYLQALRNFLTLVLLILSFKNIFIDQTIE